MISNSLTFVGVILFLTAIVVGFATSDPNTPDYAMGGLSALGLLLLVVGYVINPKR